jgi:hypothetical protein
MGQAELGDQFCFFFFWVTGWMGFKACRNQPNKHSPPPQPLSLTPGFGRLHRPPTSLPPLRLHWQGFPLFAFIFFVHVQIPLFF